MAQLPEDFEHTLAAMLTDAVSYIDEEVSPGRAKAMEYYRGDRFGDETEGRSQVVCRDVHDVVQSILPSVQRTFFGGERVVEFQPRTQEDVAAAEQATDYVNFVLDQDNDWYSQFRDCAVDGLLFGDGIGKVWHEEEEDVSVQQFQGLDEQGVMVLAGEDGELQVGQAADGTFDAILKREIAQKRFRVMALPPEQFLIDRRATDFDDAEIVAHRCHLTVNELVSMGYDREEMMEYVGDSELSTNAEVVARQPNNGMSGAMSANEGMQKVMYVEAYTRYDLDGDGIAELLKVCTAGPGYEILKSEPVDTIPFFKLSMSPNPHAFFSEGMFDRLYDVQRINSQILRLTLDSLAQSISPRLGVVENDANIEDVLNNEIGAIIRMRTPNGVTNLSQPFNGQAAFPVLDYMRQVKEARTGITGASMGVDAAMLGNVTREVANAAIASGQGQIELICRNFANGLKRMYAIMLELMVTNQDQPRIVRLRNEFIPIDPRPWNAKMDVTINVALSAGTTEQRLAMLQYQWEKQSETYSALGPNNGVVTLGQIRNTMAKIAELAGFKDAAQFWMPVPMDYDVPQQQGDPQTDPNAEATKMLAQVEKEKAQLQAQSAQMRIEAELYAKQQKLDHDAMVQAAKIQNEQAKLEMQREQMMLELEMQKAKLLQHMAKDERDAIQKAYDAEAKNTDQSQLTQAVQQLDAMMAEMQARQANIEGAVGFIQQDEMDD